MSNDIAVTLELTQREAGVLARILEACVSWDSVPEARAIIDALGEVEYFPRLIDLHYDPDVEMFVDEDKPRKCMECGK